MSVCMLVSLIVNHLFYHPTISLLFFYFTKQSLDVCHMFYALQVTKREKPTVDL